MTDKKIIELIANRKEHRALVKLYRYFSKVEKMIKRSGGEKDEAKDIFQEALIIFCKKVWAGNFQLSSKLDTYLYGICYNLWRDRLKAKKKQNFVTLDWDVEAIEGMDELLETERKISAIENVLSSIGEACFKLLKLFYYERKRVKEIVKELGYSSENTVKVQKYKCIERAKKMIKV